MSLFLSIDQGTHASRAIVFDKNGEIASSHKSDVALRQLGHGKVEQDAKEIVSSLHSVLDATRRELGDSIANVSSACLATQRSSIVCWDRTNGEALSPVLSWQDRRAADWLEQFRDREPWIKLRTGLPLSPHYGASKLRWCLDHLPAVKAAHENQTLAFGPLAAFILFRLLESHPMLVDPANSARTQLQNRKTLDWDDELLDLFGLPKSALPRCVPTCHEYGNLRLGDQRIPLNIVNGDQPAALFAHGQIQPDTAYINIGTGAFVQRSLPASANLSPRLLSGVVYADAQQRIEMLEGTVNGAGAAVSWFQTQTELDDLETHAAEWMQTVENPPLFLNGIGGVGSPYWIADLESRFVGDGGNQARLVAVLESILFLLQMNLDAMRPAFGDPQRIQISGGLVNIDPLCQRLADLSGIPAYRYAQTEATARGAAWLSAGMPESWLKSASVDEFTPRENPPLQSRFQKWLGLMPDWHKDEH